MGRLRLLLDVEAHNNARLNQNRVVEHPFRRALLVVTQLGFHGYAPLLGNLPLASLMLLDAPFPQPQRRRVWERKCRACWDASHYPPALRAHDRLPAWGGLVDEAPRLCWAGP